jgi:hypothetical protein
MQTTATTYSRPANSTGDSLLSPAGRRIAARLVNNRCPICRRKMTHAYQCSTKMTIDHFVPCARGGHNNQLLPICQGCNSSKADALFSEWLQGRLSQRIEGLGKRTSIMTEKGAARNWRRILTDLEVIRDLLTADLIEAGIWTKEETHGH